MDLSDDEVRTRFHADPSRHPTKGTRLVKGRGPYNDLIARYGPPPTPTPTPTLIQRTISQQRYDEFMKLYNIAMKASGTGKCDFITTASQLAGIQWGEANFEETFQRNLGPFQTAYQAIQNLSNDREINPKVDHQIFQDAQNFYEYSPSVDYASLSRRLEKYIQEQERFVMYYEMMCFLMDQAAIHNAKHSVLDVADLYEIEQAALRSHNPLLIDESKVYHLYNDGEITNQKGGPIYLQRTEFTVAPALGEYTHSTFQKPIFLIAAEDGHSYAVTSQEDAKQIRDAMINVVNRQ